MRSLEIFSGAGGLAKGLELAGFEHSAFVEFNKDAYASLAVNFESNKIFFGDIKAFDLNSVSAIDLVAGGPPCQPFSLGGKHKANHDSRDMFPYAIQAIEKLAPKAFIFENVKGLLRHNFSDYFEYIILRLTFPDFFAKPSMDWHDHLMQLRMVTKRHYSGIRYNVAFKLINAADYGVPQTRERVVIVGIRADLGKSWAFPEPTHSEDRLLWEMYVTGEYWQKHKIKMSHCPHIEASANEKRDYLKDRFGLFEPEFQPWKTVRDALYDVPDPRTQHRFADHIFRDGARSYAGHTGSDFDWPAKTIKAGGHGVPGGENMIRYPDGSIRYLTVFEAKRIQTFPDDFVIKGAWGEAMRQIGNAVPVLLAEVIGNRLMKILNGDTEKLARRLVSINQPTSAVMAPVASGTN
ncbi:MAG: DNA cytosine methyltransferase [Magnetococcales bacterium]|nr:DNA cytosine methyltransferase [Magnetococcales bacterium]